MQAVADPKLRGNKIVKRRMRLAIASHLYAAASSQAGRAIHEAGQRDS
jgi:hypothetical protein